jgi:hypothetical protein
LLIVGHLPFLLSRCYFLRIDRRKKVLLAGFDKRPRPIVCATVPCDLPAPQIRDPQADVLDLSLLRRAWCRTPEAAENFPQDVLGGRIKSPSSAPTASNAASIGGGFGESSRGAIAVLSPAVLR